MATYFMDGFLRGARSGRQYAFIVIITQVRALRKLIPASFYTFALYDCDAGLYDTYTDTDFPRPPRVRRRYKLSSSPGELALRYETPLGPVRWEQQRDASGALRPFAWTLALCGKDRHQAPMTLELEVEATRPPAPLGGRQLGGEMMFLGIERTYSYLQSGLELRGHLRWGTYDEEVVGNVGWIDRQWAPTDFSRQQDRQSSRYRSEWRAMQFSNGWDMSAFHQYLRWERNAVVPWSGISAQGPAPEHALRATTQVELVLPEFIKSPGVVRSRYMLTDGPRWFPYCYRMRVSEWDMEVEARPFVDAPAHALPIEYWTGPVRLRGRVFGQEVDGLGFDERTRPWLRPFELAEALRLTVEHLPGIDDEARWLLAYRVAEVGALALRRDRRAARVHLAQRVEPLVRQLPEAARARVAPLARDVREVLGR